MTSTSEYGPWVEMLLVLAVGTGLIVGLAALGARAVRSAVWQRTFWQVATVALAVLCAVQWTGISTALVCLWRAPVQTPDQPMNSPRGGWSARCGRSPDRATGLTEGPANSEETCRSAVPAGSRDPRRAQGSGDPRPVQGNSGRAHAEGLVSQPSPLAPRAGRGAGGEGASYLPPTSNRQPEPDPAPGHSFSSASPSRASSVDATSATVPVQSPAPLSPGRLDRGAWLGAFWALGAALLMGQIVWTRVVLCRFRWRQAVPSDDRLRQRVATLARRLGIRRKVAVLEAAGLPSPVAMGILCPAVVLPTGFCRQFDARQQEAMLAHELAHVAALDSLWLGLADLLAAVLWWHPLAWWSRRRVRMASEAAADEASLLVPDGPDLLAACLVALGRRLAGPRLGWLSVQGPHFRSGLGRRVERLLSLSSRPWPMPRRRTVALARTALVIALVVVSVSCTAWAMPQANFLEGGTTMNVLVKSWRHSLAAAVLTAVLAPGPALAAEERERPRDPTKPAVREGERPREAERPAAKEERERPRPEAELREVVQRRRALEEKAGDIKRKLESLKPDQDADAKELQAALKKIHEELRGLPAPPRDSPPERERIQRRLEELKQAVQQAKEAGKADEAERLEREARELVQAVQRGREPRGPEGPEAEQARRRLAELKEALQRAKEAGKADEVERLEREARELVQAVRRGPGGPPEGREDVERRMKHLREAIENLHAAGLHEQADALARSADRFLREPGDRGGRRPEREEPTRARREGPPPVEQMERTVQELRDQVMELRRQMEEMREHLKRLAQEKRGEK